MVFRAGNFARVKFVDVTYNILVYSYHAARSPSRVIRWELRSLTLLDGGFKLNLSQ